MNHTRKPRDYGNNQTYEQNTGFVALPGNRGIALPDGRFVYDSEGIAYELGGQLARTGNSKLLHAVDTETGEAKVFKFTGRDKVLAERQAIEDLNGHPNVLSLSDAGIYEAPRGLSSALITDFVPGKTLDEFVPHEDSEKNMKHFGQIVVPLIDTVEVVQTLHEQGKVARDIKPGQTIVHAITGRGIVTDLQTVTMEGEEDLGRGTLGFLPPEAIAGLGQTEHVEVRRESDIYALSMSIGGLLVGFKDDAHHQSTVSLTEHMIDRTITSDDMGQVVDLFEVREIAPPHLAEVLEAAAEDQPENRCDIADIKNALIETRDLIAA